MRENKIKLNNDRKLRTIDVGKERKKEKKKKRKKKKTLKTKKK